MDLPTIVARIHEQRPDIDLPEMDFFPGVPGAVAPAWRITVGRETFYVPHFVAIAIVEAALWRAWHTSDGGTRGEVHFGLDSRTWFVSDGHKITPYPQRKDGELELIRVLCHAVGIELELEDNK